MTVVSLQDTKNLRASAVALLEHEIKAEYESVIVIGYKDQMISIHASQHIHRHTLAGAIQDAVQQILSGEMT